MSHVHVFLSLSARDLFLVPTRPAPVPPHIPTQLTCSKQVTSRLAEALNTINKWARTLPHCITVRCLNAVNRCHEFCLCQSFKLCLTSNATQILSIDLNIKSEKTSFRQQNLALAAMLTPQWASSFLRWYCLISNQTCFKSQSVVSMFCCGKL